MACTDALHAGRAKGSFSYFQHIPDLSKNVIAKLFVVLLSCLFLACGSETGHLDEGPQRTYESLSLEERQSPAHAIDAMSVAEGLVVELFAAEPMVINPTNMAIDETGRVWVCESPAYALSDEEINAIGGRIVILEDTSGDGKADLRKVFYEGEDVHLALGIAVFGDLVFVTRSPNLLVFEDKDQDDVPEHIDTLFTGMGGPGDHSAHAVVFGPDGRFYFNYGNAGNKILYPDQTPVIDQAGHPVRSDGKPYYGGMIFRFDAKGKNLETLAHNFRNNYEVAVDAFGSLWQSDNDDDGHRSVRINYILEFGNYGYLDEPTGLHWSQARVGMSDSTPLKHWHQNDPGVVPNLLITGAGSPSGITVYEGKLLPELLQGQVIHADAGPNVVRAYPVEPDGAGFSSQISNILKHPHDQWFRPVDVSVAPDGSLFVADWYDPIVGGAAAGDHRKGRIFRVAPTGHAYRVDPPRQDALQTSIDLINSPNEDVRYQAWQEVHDLGIQAEEELKKEFELAGDARHRSRALWLLGQIEGRGDSYVNQALRDADPQIRIVGIRLARQLQLDIVAMADHMTNDSSMAVLRELAIALRFADDEQADRIWGKLASRYQGDRWYLEALGIGADLCWESRYKAWLAQRKNRSFSTLEQDIVWRSRAPAAAKHLVSIIADSSSADHHKEKFFRAFDFHQHDSKQANLMSILDLEHPDQSLLRSMALQMLDADEMAMTPELVGILGETLSELQGTWQFVDLVEKYDLSKYKEALLELGSHAFENPAAFGALRVLSAHADWGGLDMIRA